MALGVVLLAAGEGDLMPALGVLLQLAAGEGDLMSDLDVSGLLGGGDPGAGERP